MLCAHDSGELQSCGQIYVNLEDLVSTEQGFWFSSNQYSEVIGATGLQIDPNGGSSLIASGVKWICSVCNTVNDMYSSYCTRCNAKGPFD